MNNKSFKQIDILRKRREETLLLDPYFIDNKKFIKKGIFFGTSLILTTLFIGIVFIIRTNILEQRKSNIREYVDQYDSLVINLDNESIELKKIAEFNKNLKQSISNINSSSAFFKEISRLVPKGMQLTEININGEKLTLKSRINHKKPLELLNAFLILLDDSEFLNFDAIDLNKINTFENDSEDQLYEFNIQSKISNKFADINQKYLDELGSLGLSNRIKNLDKIFENKI
ncbi:PilN domain-containing protein [Prochlorococcus marinus XMU1419]|uniref:PilN domain-containing protein n=1 Tax=Prochlorococcus marinus TaxID=1219 RepID=UPI001ADC7C82|nr:PilN domain-containing protein [Prochlorococcus marinus]MBO8233572.1 PilN domain-containing protein [Prochlorococcus marinus XMU1419]MBW3077052.1 hypothetical protein [Prochlorococcus marinus str. XMU1419]